MWLGPSELCRAFGSEEQESLSGTAAEVVVVALRLLLGVVRIPQAVARGRRQQSDPAAVAHEHPPKLILVPGRCFQFPCWLDLLEGNGQLVTP